ncbi:calcium-binding protein [Cypionkella psychrotolerans]|uniref:calcium-binding protein n=1 Tax=Cypionkella psychrotolerans TaxID=1678131 RepID=UPI0006B51A59|nr:calcium-binding protein [Cypionkella psychrotolerans]
MQGGTGNDAYYVDSLGDLLAEQTASGTDVVIAAMDWALGSNFETLILDGADNLNGSGNTAANLINSYVGDNASFGMTGNDTLNGGGNDTLDGGGGVDTMTGGNGDDSYVVDAPSDRVTEAASGGADTVLSSVSLILAVIVENLTLTGQAAINAIGNAADNLLSGLAGADTMIGRLGNDSYTVDSVLDVLFENADEGTDLITSSVSWTLGSGFENLILSGSTASSGTGNAQANAITGNGAANRLLGQAGDDLLTRDAGNDRLTGGAGADHFVFTALASGADQGDVMEFSGLLIGTFAYMGGAAFSGGSDNCRGKGCWNSAAGRCERRRRGGYPHHPKRPDKRRATQHDGFHLELNTV